MSRIFLLGGTVVVVVVFSLRLFKHPILIKVLPLRRPAFSKVALTCTQYFCYCASPMHSDGYQDPMDSTENELDGSKTLLYAIGSVPSSQSFLKANGGIHSPSRPRRALKLRVSCLLERTAQAVATKIQ
eukprot:6251802-Amphidinium_carterae.1